MGNMLRHSSIQASIAAGAVMGGIQATVTPVPWWLWATWAALSVVSVRQAVRDRAVDA